jgi:sulfur-oxidizing protein SoxY
MTAPHPSNVATILRRRFMNSRREMLKSSAAVAAMLIGAGFLPRTAQAQASGFNAAAFDAKTVADAVKAYGGSAPVESKEVSITGPDIAENGAVVPLGAASTAAGVKRLMVMVEKNPNALAAMFEFTDGVEPSVKTRVKMGQSSDVYAVAMMNDGRVLYAKKEVKVTLGGCGG